MRLSTHGGDIDVQTQYCMVDDHSEKDAEISALKLLLAEKEETIKEIKKQKCQVRKILMRNAGEIEVSKEQGLGRYVSEENRIGGSKICCCRHQTRGPNYVEFKYNYFKLR